MAREARSKALLCSGLPQTQLLFTSVFVLNLPNGEKVDFTKQGIGNSWVQHISQGCGGERGVQSTARIRPSLLGGTVKL